MKAKSAKRPGEVIVELNQRDEPLFAANSAGPVESQFRLKKILVRVNFSDCSKKALQYAIPFAKEHQAALTLLYVVAPPGYYAVGDGGGFNYGAFQPDYGAIEAELRDSGGKQLADLVTNVIHRQVSTETSVRSGQPAFEIIEAAKELPADLIIMSTHGRTGLKHLFLGASPNTSFGRLPARRWSSGIGSMNLSDLTCGSLKYR